MRVASAGSIVTLAKGTIDGILGMRRHKVTAKRHRASGQIHWDRSHSALMSLCIRVAKSHRWFLFSSGQDLWKHLFAKFMMKRAQTTETFHRNEQCPVGCGIDIKIDLVLNASHLEGRCPTPWTSEFSDTVSTCELLLHISYSFNRAG
jgi:hypothetical protein